LKARKYLTYIEMVENINVTNKKIWAAPTFLELDFNQTQGGTDRDTGENQYEDPTSGG
jgi:hypothetical protein